MSRNATADGSVAYCSPRISVSSDDTISSNSNDFRSPENARLPSVNACSNSPARAAITASALPPVGLLRVWVFLWENHRAEVPRFYSDLLAATFYAYSREVTV